MEVLLRFLEEIENAPSPEGTRSILVDCKDKMEQESKRVGFFNKRRKFARHIQNMIGIRKLDIEGKLFVEIYRPITKGLFFYDGEKIVPMTVQSAEKQRMIELMRRDGVPEEEIEELTKNV